MKRTFPGIATLVVIAALAAPSIAAAQERPLVPLKLDLVVSRMDGTKKVASLPYTLYVTANDQQLRNTSLRVGSQVPIANTRVAGKDDPPPPAYSYRDIGMQIDSGATTVADGRYHVRIVLNDSSVHGDMKEARANLPVFRSFSASFALILRDGQTATYTSATDPLTGEMLKVDVTLTVLK